MGISADHRISTFIDDMDASPERARRLQVQAETDGLPAPMLKELQSMFYVIWREEMGRRFGRCPYCGELPAVLLMKAGDRGVVGCPSFDPISDVLIDASEGYDIWWRPSSWAEYLKGEKA